jgi:hypothetical protein
MTIGKPFQKGKSGNPLHPPHETPQQTPYSTEAMASRRSTSLGEGGPQYVVRLPEPCKTVDEWVTSLGDRSAQTTSNGSMAQQESRGSA